MGSSLSRTNWPLVAMLFLAGLLAAAQFAKLSLALRPLAAAYGRGVEDMAVLVSIPGIVGIVFGLVAGNVVAALGPRRVVLGALALGAAVSLAEALLPPLPAMVGLRVVEGISHLGLVVAGPTLMAGAAGDRDRPVVMGIWATFFAMAFAISAGLVPWLIGRGGMPLLLVCHGAAMATMIVVLAPMIAPQPRRPLRLAFFRDHAEIYATPRLAAPAVGFVFYTLLFVALVTLLPLRLGQPWLAAILPVLNLVGTFAAGWVAKRVAPDLVAMAGFTLVLGLTLTLWAGARAAVYPLFLSMGLLPGASFAAIPFFNGDLGSRARSTGAVAQLGNVGTTCGTPLFAAILVAAGLGGLYAAVALIAATGLGATVLTRRAVGRREKKSLPVFLVRSE